MKPKLSRTPDFDRLRKALLSQGEPDCVPNLELGVHPVFKERIIGRPCRTVADEIEFAQTTGYDYIKLQPGIDMNPGKIYPAGGQQIIGERKWASEHSGVITNMQEFDRYVWPKPADISYSRFEDACRLLPDNMQVIGQYGDIFTFIWESMGFETFCVAAYEDPDLITAMFEKVGSIIFSMYENMVQVERVGAMWLSDDLAYTNSLMVGPDIYREHLFPWMKKIGDLCRGRGIPYLFHSDGVLWEVLDDIIECGVTSLHPIEPKAMDAAEVKQRAGGKLCVCGSIEVDLLARGTPDEIEAEVVDRLRRVAPGGGYTLGSSNSIPEYCSMANYLRMLETGDRLGRYPISV